MTNLNVLNKKLNAMGMRDAAYYVTEFAAFNKGNISKPQSQMVDGPWVYDIDIMASYDVYYSSFKRDGIELGIDAVLNPGEVIIVSYLLNGSTITDTCVITDTGYQVTESMCDMSGYRAFEGYKDGLYLYTGVRQDFFNLVDLPDCGVSHELFDYIVEELNPHK